MKIEVVWLGENGCASVNKCDGMVQMDRCPECLGWPRYLDRTGAMACEDCGLEFMHGRETLQEGCLWVTEGVLI